MSYKIIFLVFNLFLAQSLFAEFDHKKVQLSWGEGDLNVSSFHTDYLSVGDGNEAIILFDIKNLHLNLKRQNLYMNLRLGKISNLVGVEIRLYNKKSDVNYLSHNVPIYSDFEFNIFHPYNWTKYGLSRGNFNAVGNEPKNLNYLVFKIHVKKHPFNLGLKKVWKKEKLAPGIVSITFDDGYKSQILAAKIMKKYGFTGTAYIMPRNTGEENIMSLKELKTLKRRFKWDLQSHHASPLTWMNKDEIKREMNFGFDYMKKYRLASSNKHLAYPLGKQLPGETRSTIRNIFDTARIAGGGMEVIPPANNHLIKTFNVMNTTTVVEIKKQIEIAKQNRQWLILMFHYIKDDPKNALEYTPSSFEQFCKELKESGIKVLTIDQVWKKYLKRI